MPFLVQCSFLIFQIELKLSIWIKIEILMPTLYSCKILMKYPRILLLLFLLLMPAPGRTEGANTAKPPPSKKEIQQAEAPTPQNNLVDFLSYITDLSKRFVEFKSQIDESNIPPGFHNDLSEISDQIQLLSREVSAISTNAEINYDHLEIIKTQVYELGYQVEKVNNPVLKIIENLSKSNTEWEKRRQALERWSKIEDGGVTSFVKENVAMHQKNIGVALELVSEKMTCALAAQKKASDLDIQIHYLILDIEKITKQFIKKSVEKKGSIFSFEFYSKMDKDLLVTIWKNAVVAAKNQKQLLADHFKIIFALCLVTFILSLFIQYSKKWVKGSDIWYFFAGRPVASAFFLCLVCLHLAAFFNERVDQLYKGWTATGHIIFLCSVLRLSPVLFEESWKKAFFSMTIISVILIEFFRLLNLPQVIFYLYTFLATFLILLFLVLQGRKLSRQKRSFAELLCLRLGAIILSTNLVLVILGFQNFAFYFFHSLLGILTFSCIFGLLVLAAKSIMELLLLAVPLMVTRRNSSIIVTHLTPVIILFFSYVVFILALKFLGIYPTKKAAMEGLESFNLAAGSWVISPGKIFSAGVVIYCVFLFSKTIQGLLLQEVLPRYNTARGVQFSIVRLVNYAILSFGFILVLHMLGFGLESLSLFGGALGIGIGFGLQAIITNVASGLILLFEQPIKVGDMVQVNNEYGEIKKVGLRATVVQTLDSAEIVIPNSDLVIGQVTNWTLAERQTRVKVPVGVAYGTDTAKALKILMDCADECPMVLSNPKPKALLLSFGESSLNFELRVWIPEFNDRRTVLSELNQQIEEEFRLAGIEIPFPKRDVYLHNVPNE